MGLPDNVERRRMGAPGAGQFDELCPRKLSRIPEFIARASVRTQLQVSQLPGGGPGRSRNLLHGSPCA
jgi:hypothetical protein